MSSTLLANPLIIRLVGFVLYLYLRFVQLTSVIEFTNEAEFRKIENNKIPTIFLLWHKYIAFSPFFLRDNTNVAAVISLHRDGEAITRTLANYGINFIRGSKDSGRDKGGAAALIGIKKALKAGRFVAYTPDGPRGPIYEVKESIYFIARTTNAQFACISASCSRGKQFKSWDEFVLPLPFSKITLRLDTILQSSDIANMQLDAISSKIVR
jgi:lysophospholipid acyltransferase (LPLAT)-like uncharacterized protein